MKIRVSLLLTSLVLVSACSKTPVEPVAVTMPLTATIQDIMHGLVDPSADLLWESVGTEVTSKGEVVQQPQTDEEWDRLRNAALTLTEATTLLAMQGRKVVADGKEVEDAHVTGIRAAAEIEAAIAADRTAWVGFTQSLHATGVETLRAVEARDATRLLKAGEALDAVCEACHLKYWYPGQVIPKL